MNTEKRANKQQKELLLERLHANIELARGNQANKHVKQFWANLASELNVLGCSMKMQEWQHVWSVWVSITITKARKIQRSLHAGGGPGIYAELDDAEAKILEVVGSASVYGHDSIELGIIPSGSVGQTVPALDVPCTSSACEEELPQILIVRSRQPPPSSQPATSQPALSQPVPSQPALSQAAPSQPALSQPSPNQLASSQPALSQPALSQPAPSQPALSQPAPSQLTPNQHALNQPALSQPAVSQPTPSQHAPNQPAPSQPLRSHNSDLPRLAGGQRQSSRGISRRRRTNEALIRALNENGQAWREAVLQAAHEIAEAGHVIAAAITSLRPQP